MCAALFRHQTISTSFTKHIFNRCLVRSFSDVGSKTTAYKCSNRNTREVNSWFLNRTNIDVQIASRSGLCNATMDLAESGNASNNSSLTMTDSSKAPLETSRDTLIETDYPEDSHGQLVLAGEQHASGTHDVNATCNQEVYDDQPRTSFNARDISNTKPQKTSTILKGSLLSKVCDLVRENPQIVPEERSSSHDDTQPSTSLVTMVPMDTCATTNGSPAEKRVAHSQSSRKANKRRKKNSPNTNQSELGSENKDPPQRPNYFVAIQVTDPQVHRRLKIVQDHILSQEPRLSAAREPLSKLHITVLVVYLADNEDIKRAIQAMEDCGDMLRDLERDLVTLNIVGVDNFRDNVVFANIEDGIQKEKLCKIAEAVQNAFCGRGLVQTDDRAFAPHLTLFKLSKAPKLRKKGIRKIDRALYEEVVSEYFGCQGVAGLQLCSMMKPKDHRGYYHTDHNVELHQTVAEDPTQPDDDEAISSFSRTLASDVIARAVEVVWAEQLTNCRADKLARNPKRRHPNKSRGKSDVVVTMDDTREGHVAIVQLHKELSWTFQQAHAPNLNDVIDSIKSTFSDTND